MRKILLLFPIIFLISCVTTPVKNNFEPITEVNPDESVIYIYRSTKHTKSPFRSLVRARGERYIKVKTFINNSELVDIKENEYICTTVKEGLINLLAKSEVEYGLDFEAEGGKNYYFEIIIMPGSGMFKLRAKIVEKEYEEAKTIISYCNKRTI